MKEYDVIAVGTGSAMYVVDGMMQRNPDIKVKNDSPLNRIRVDNSSNSWFEGGGLTHKRHDTIHNQTTGEHRSRWWGLHRRGIRTFSLGHGIECYNNWSKTAIPASGRTRGLSHSETRTGEAHDNFDEFGGNPSRKNTE